MFLALVLDLSALLGGALFLAIIYGLIQLIFKIVPGATTHPIPAVVWFVYLVLCCLVLAWALGIPIPFISVRV
jgi:hypothetical protein